MALRRSRTPSRDADRAPRPAPGGGRPGATGDSLIAAGMVLNGDCRTDGTLRVEGHVTGNVQANRLTIGPTGRVDGDVTGDGGGGSEHAVLIEGHVGGAIRAPRVEIGRDGAVGAGMNVKEAVVRGRVVGAVVTEHRLLLEETAIVEGDVTARRLGLKEGGQVFGTIRIGEPPAGETASGRGGPPAG
ncbi:MAG TPA: polymer-forming cytoskeletal protein [Longimicrobiales bacterium]|nr:polymer-forming cytoskeletal protein [Longimicrobiales bacterium]